MKWLNCLMYHFVFNFFLFCAKRTDVSAHPDTQARIANRNILPAHHHNAKMVAHVNEPANSHTNANVHQVRILSFYLLLFSFVSSFIL